MAEPLTAPPRISGSRSLLLIALGLVAALGSGFAFFYHHENHAPLEVTVTRVLTLPLHVKYGHVQDTAGPDQTEDAIYILPILSVKDRSDVPLFVKDITASVTLADGREDAGRRVGAADRERLQQLVPQIAPLLKQAAVPPLDPEQRIDKDTTAQGYTVLLFSMPAAEWDKRKSVSVTLDFYHQESVTIPLPR